ncbi:MAG TPA: acyltransferase [Abditibacteriaceae bacterium]
MSHEATQTPSTRYVFIDALRGIAALAVLFHHMLHNSVMEVTLRRILPLFVQKISTFGACGVQIFFVISGFVIAHSLRNTYLSWQGIGNFALRRQLRLDLPYWTILFVALIVHRLELMVPSLKTDAMPTLGDMLLNLFYLQDIFHAPRVLEVAWTLCIEVQFYLLFIVLLLAGSLTTQRNPKSSGNSSLPVGNVALVVVTGLLSLYIGPSLTDSPWCIAYWFYFAAGVLCYWSLMGLLNPLAFLVFMLIFAGATVYYGSQAMTVGLVTTGMIYGIGHMGHLTDWFNNRVIQYFGRISYSLYLVHLPVITVVLRLGYKLTEQNQSAALLWYLVAGATSIGIAQLLHIAVEQPSMRLATRLKPTRHMPPVITQVTATAPLEPDVDSVSGFKGGFSEPSIQDVAARPPQEQSGAQHG